MFLDTSVWSSTSLKAPDVSTVSDLALNIAALGITLPWRQPHQLLSRGWWFPSERNANGSRFCKTLNYNVYDAPIAPTKFLANLL